ncbi:TAT-variant-translocated molybdopterin oxidoreductase [Zavarzinella formosa]|uniref:TAT-variant-translocated molybdopterin oxidoreductase n=1 Tax=Zavarzinella formosa TaxID=360055 RepID=UPI0002D8BCFE|nr:TAT-variant-translocated molybdopterin oxidoreductase [Zavarzinella formosa]
MALRTDSDNPIESGGGDDLWLGLEHFANTPEFTEMLHREFPEDATAWNDPVSRRTFLTLSGASVALAGIGCSPRPASREKIYPYVKQPEQITPGLPLFFATGHAQQGVTSGILVKSREGRPIKIEGNPSHPGSLGSTDVFMQASLLNLYDPDRSRQVINGRTGDEITWDTAIGQLKGKLPKTAKVRILTETVGSPSLAQTIDTFAKQFTPAAEWVQYEPVNRDNVREGSKLAFGEYVNAVYDFTKALRVVSLDSDFLGGVVGGVRYAKDFNSLRKTAVPGKDKDGHTAMVTPTADQMNRLYSVESTLSPTGAVADHRLPMKSVEIESFVRALAKELGVNAGEGGALPDLAKKWLAPLVKDLQANKGKSIVIAGDHQPAAVHAIVHNINEALGNIGTTVKLTKPVEAKPSNQLADYKKLVEEMAAGKVDAVLILGVNPVYSSPADIDFVGALKKVPLKVHMGSHLDETAILCDYHFNEAHALETWGDGRAFDGTASISQPLIAPLFNGHSILELIASLTTNAALVTGMEIVKTFWQNQPKDGGTPPDFSIWWQHVLQDGVVPKSEFPAVAKKPATTAIPAYKAPGKGTELNLRADPNLFDGRFANNGWLQELPRPITKLTWDNAAIISPKTAADLGFSVGIMRSGGGEHGKAQVDIGELTIGGKKLTVAVWIQPMHVDDSITLYLGSGRERSGQIGNTGFNGFKVRSAESPDISVGAELKPTGEKFILACTQSHFSMEGRRPARSAYLEEFRENPNFAKVAAIAAPEWREIDETLPGNEHKHEEHGHDHDHGEKKSEGGAGKKEEHHEVHDKRTIPLTMYPPTNKEGRRWAMAIDLTQCNGCSVCLIACQAENNVPVVGKTQVTKGREMHWIRVDRYYEGTDPNDAANLVAHFQPVPCQQCEKAPCEVVCPVAATLHSTDGLNDMVYNRCVGTRYCSNNCPYKVRRFNFLTFADWKTDTLKLMRNPEVTVRERGVMEKCTYCVQRIRSAEIEAERQFRGIKDGEVVTACQAACPSGAITFGDLSIKDSMVNQKKAQSNNYGLLAELNTLPRTTYLAAIRNPNPEMPRA